MKYSTKPIPTEETPSNIVTNPIPLDRILTPEEIEKLEREE
jgi:hypothetical protein